MHLIRYGKKDILKILNERMQEASDRLEFETAALLRDPGKKPETFQDLKRLQAKIREVCTRTPMEFA